MIIIHKKSIVLTIVAFMAIFLVCMGFKENLLETNGEIREYKIVVDAGHGNPDGGAISSDGIEEASLNLQVALKLKEMLEENGYKVVMTRTNEENIADSDKQNSIKEIKVSDLSNRVKIANESKADFMVSIHMNKYSDSKYWGWQTFYSKNSENGKELATIIQNSISKNIDRENKRVALPIEGIKIVDKTNIPVVIVECGFLSNQDDLNLLQTDAYQTAIVKGIFEGIDKFYK